MKIIFLLIPIFCFGCVFPKNAGPMGEDVVASYMKPVNDHYRESKWTYLPTGIGNIVGGAALTPLAAIVLPFELTMRGSIDEAPVVNGVISTGAHVGGFAVGSPFMIFRYAFVELWSN